MTYCFTGGPVNGQWSDWSQWSACAKSCGGSNVTRKRSCNNPPPQRGGEECPGEAMAIALDCETPCPGEFCFNLCGELSLNGINLFFYYFSQSTEIGASGKNGPSVVLHVGLEREYEHVTVTAQRLSMEASVLVPASKLKPVEFGPVL